MSAGRPEAPQALSTNPIDGTQTLDVQVVDKKLICPGVMSVTLTSASGQPLPQWQAGAHISLVLEGGMERQYSLCGEQGDPNWRIAVRLEDQSRGGSVYIHNTLAVGDSLVVRPPRNNFKLEPAARYVFVAGGIGITPLLPMIREVDAQGISWTLHYAVRDIDSAPFRDILGNLTNGSVNIYSRNLVGRMKLADLFAHLQDEELVYCCGPSSLMEEIEALSSRWPAGRLHLERFTRLTDPPSSDGDHPFTVHLRQSRCSIRVERDETILAAILKQGISVPSSCREGLCGTCETSVLSGEIDHRDGILTPEEREEGDYMMICVSRARGDELELDV